jgi:hypothetical protein
MLKKIWDWLDGRKREIGAALGPIIVWLAADKIIDQPTQVLLAALLSAWVAGAFIHAGIKGDL